MSGFLGAGKTSVLLQLAHCVVGQAPEQANRIAIIENEIGDIGVDDQTLGASGSYSVQSLFSGCICCTLLGSLVEAVRKLEDEMDPEYIVIEPTGVADPTSIARQLEEYAGASVRIISVVDAERWHVIERALGQLIDGQVGQAEMLLMSKIDKVDKATADAVEAALRARNGVAPIYRINANEPINENILDEMCGLRDE